MVSNLVEKIRIWYLKWYRYFFIPEIINYKVPDGLRLFEYNLITKEVKKAQYKNHRGHRIFVKNENCIYNCSINERNARIQFEELINKALKK